VLFLNNLARSLSKLVLFPNNLGFNPLAISLPLLLAPFLPPGRPAQRLPPLLNLRLSLKLRLLRQPLRRPRLLLLLHSQARTQSRRIPSNR